MSIRWRRAIADRLIVSDRNSWTGLPTRGDLSINVKYSEHGGCGEWRIWSCTTRCDCAYCNPYLPSECLLEKLTISSSHVVGLSQAYLASKLISDEHANLWTDRLRASPEQAVAIGCLVSTWTHQIWLVESARCVCNRALDGVCR